MKVFVNGCFDLLHAGHVAFLSFAASFGSLTVGLNSDVSVRKIKGDERPIIPQDDRRYVLERLMWVDRVVLFDEETAVELLKKVDPDVYVCGCDHTPLSDELAWCNANGKQVRIWTVRHESTSDIIERIRHGNQRVRGR